MNTSFNWARQPQDWESIQDPIQKELVRVKLDYFFNGNRYLTQGITAKLDRTEIEFIFRDVRVFVLENKGVDHIISYTNHLTNETIFIMDQLSQSMLDTGTYTGKDHYFTVLLAHEF